MAESKVIAVDIGGTNMRVSLVKGTRVLKYLKESTPKTQEEIMSKLDNMISSLITKDVAGIGVGCPGPLENGVVKNPPNLPFRNFNLKKALHDRFKVRVEVENDAKCVALAEMVYGFKKKNFLILTIGTGIGGGIIINGKLYKGQGYGGEIGHIVLDHGEYFERLAASRGLKKLTLEAFGRDYLVKDLIKMNNKKSKKILSQITTYLGQGIASLVNVFDPELVVVCGGVKEAGNYFLNPIREQVKKYSVLPRAVKIEWTKLEHPGTLGASLLLSNKIKELE
jgi:glucokinase